MTKEEALSKVEGYLTNLLPSEDYDEVEEIIEALKQEPFINKPCCVSSGVCEHDKQKALDNISAEIEQLTIAKGGNDYVRKMAELYCLKIKVLQIINKYRAESKTEQGLSYADQDTLMSAT